MQVKHSIKRPQRPFKLSAKLARKGQSLVEFSMMLTLIFFLLMGLLDVGRVYFSYLALQDLAGEGASYGSIYPTRKTSTDKANPDNITFRVLNGAPAGLLMDISAATVTITNSTEVGEQITVQITVDYTVLTPFIGTLVGSQTLPLSASSTSVILTNSQ